MPWKKRPTRDYDDRYELSLDWCWEHPAWAKYFRDWENGKFSIPGLTVAVKLVDGTEIGPCKFNGTTRKSIIMPLPKVVLEPRQP